MILLCPAGRLEAGLADSVIVKFNLGNSRWTYGPLFLAGTAVVLWLWHCWCVFPWLLWNELRLEPSFLLAHGGDVYPAPGHGPITTWIYGPVTPALLLPATFAVSTASALMVAATINGFIVAGAILLVCLYWPVPAGVNLGLSARSSAALLCLVIWPSSSFQYIQADNAAVAFGLLANLLLMCSRSESDWRRWVAAIGVVAAIGCKQTAVGALLAQVIWLGWREGWMTATRHVVRAAVCGVILALGCLAYFEPAGLWLNLIQIPSQLPWTAEGFVRIQDMSSLLAIHVGAPLALLIYARRTVWSASSPWLLPALTWLAALPPGLAALFKIGGTLNSLESFVLFLPPGLLLLLTLSRGQKWAQSIMLVVALCLAVLRLQLEPTPTWRPRTSQLYQGEQIARQFPGQIWFPWNPLITYFAEGRFDQVEDGLFVRFVAGQPLTFTEARAHLPPDWNGMAMLNGTSDWGLATHLCPPNAVASSVGFWSLKRWSTANSPLKSESPAPTPGL